jgi:paraquat-inducible protein B
LRAQPRSGSLLTGKLYVALDFVSASVPVHFDPALRPLELPTVAGSYQELENGITRMVKKVNDLPLQQIAGHLDLDLKDLHGTLAGLNGQLLPRAVDTLTTLHDTLETVGRTLEKDSPLQQSITDTLSDTRGTLDAVKDLAGYLDRHPEALVRGRHRQSVPTSGASEDKP